MTLGRGLSVALLSVVLCQARAACPARAESGTATETVNASTIHRFGVDAAARQVAAFAVDGTILLWDVGSGRERILQNCHPVKVNGLAFDDAAHRLAIGDAEGKVEVFNPQSTTDSRHPVVDTGAAIGALLFKPGSPEIVVVHNDGFALWNLSAAKKLWEQRANYVEALAFDQSGRFLAAGFSNDVLVVETGRGRVQQTISPGLGIVNAVLFSEDSRQLWVGGERGLALFDLPSGNEIKKLAAQSDVAATGISSDQRYLTAVDANAKVTRWDLTIGAAIQSWQSETSGIISKDGRFLVGKIRDVPGEIRIWDVTSREYRTLRYGSPNANMQGKKRPADASPAARVI